VVSFSPELTAQWLQSHRVSDSIFSRGVHGIPTHLITGLPANLLILFPPSARAMLKWPLYAGSALLWLVGLWQGTKLARAKLDDPAWIALTLVIGASLCALTLPHLLYYDLCVLLPAGVLLLGKRGPVPRRTGFFALALIGWIVVSGFLPLLLTFNEQKVPPLILELVLFILFLGFLRELQSLLQLQSTRIAQV
jgi:hypothetical protein